MPSQKIPCLELKNRIPHAIYREYWSLLHNEHAIPCQPHFEKVPIITKTMWIERLLIERLERKSIVISEALERNKNDWEETFWQFTARYFGSKVNAEPMEMLAQHLPHRILAKHKNHLFQTEALLFGQAGLLRENFQDDYLKKLKKEYEFLKHKHSLAEPLPTQAWKFGRLRPPSFPTIRLSQLACLIHKSTHLFSKILENKDISTLTELFDVEVSVYWTEHFVFDTPSVYRPKKFGKEAIDVLLINNIAPFLFLYGKTHNDDALKERAIGLLEQLNPEKNTIIDIWKTLHISADNAAMSQGLIELKTNYCDKKQCLNCSIGNAILKDKTTS